MPDGTHFCRAINGRRPVDAADCSLCDEPEESD
jgi:hypothetical protein